MNMRYWSSILALGLINPVFAVPDEKTVTSTGYNLSAGQTDSTPDIAAWGDKVTKNLCLIAVSEDLKRQGYTRGVVVQIKGLPCNKLHSNWIVLDTMNIRWKNKVDVLFPSRKQAINWGKRTIEITFVKNVLPLPAKRVKRRSFLKHKKLARYFSRT